MRRAAPAAAVGIALFVAACFAPWVGLYTGDAPADVKLFQTFGERMLGGEIPYRDFFVEYPPGALPAFVLPALGHADDFVVLFKSLQIGFGAAAIALVALTLALLGATQRRLYLATTFAALAPLALGPTVLNRYDLWPAALLAAALAALVAGRTALGLGVLGFAVIAKGYAIAAVPPVLLYVWARGGRNELRRGTIAFVATALVVALPFLVTGPGGLRHAFSIQTSRGLHIESLGGSILAAADRLGLYGADVVSGFAFELHGSLADAVAVLATLLQLAAVVAVWILYRRGPATGHRLVVSAAAAVAAFAAFGKVLSPQFLIWLIPLVPLAGGLVAPGLLLAALALTQAFFPDRYRGVLDIGSETWLVLGRNIVLVALFAVLAAQLRAQRE
ncbi:MAG TPA: hypothetical protein VFV62_01025 [Gaiellaceae bacterium]|nr:hypothetical protein [Gaiellaceae bacterium]